MEKFNYQVANKVRELIGQHVRERRAELAITQAQLSEQSQVSLNTLISIEAGSDYPFTSLIAVLGCLRGHLELSWKDIDSKPQAGIGGGLFEAK